MTPQPETRPLAVYLQITGKAISGQINMGMIARCAEKRTELNHVGLMFWTITKVKLIHVFQIFSNCWLNDKVGYVQKVALRNKELKFLECNKIRKIIQKYILKMCKNVIPGNTCNTLMFYLKPETPSHSWGLLCNSKLKSHWPLQ